MMSWGRRREEAILAVLSDGEELPGLEIVKQSGGLVKRGTVYVTLANLVDRGLLASRVSETRIIDGKRYERRVYRLVRRA